MSEGGAPVGGTGSVRGERGDRGFCKIGICSSRERHGASSIVLTALRQFYSKARRRDCRHLFSNEVLTMLNDYYLMGRMSGMSGIYSSFFPLL